LKKFNVIKVKETVWLIVGNLGKNIHFRPLLKSEDTFEEQFLCLLSINSLNYALRNESIFFDSLINIERLRYHIDNEVSLDTILIEILKTTEDAGRRSNLTIKINPDGLISRFLGNLPLTGLVCMASLAVLLRKHLVLVLQDAFFFSSKYPQRLDSSLEQLDFYWGVLDYNSHRKIFAIIKEFDLSKKENKIRSLCQLAESESSELILASLPSIYSIEYSMKHVCSDYQIFTFQYKFEFLKYAVHHSRIIIVEDAVSLLIAWLTKDKIVLSSNEFLRKDFSWGKVLMHE
jgi:hypothetical protein